MLFYDITYERSCAPENVLLIIVLALPTPPCLLRCRLQYAIAPAQVLVKERVRKELLTLRRCITTVMSPDFLLPVLPDGLAQLPQILFTVVLKTTVNRAELRNSS
jgi:hypothetical protein